MKMTNKVINPRTALMAEILLYHYSDSYLDIYESLEYLYKDTDIEGDFFGYLNSTNMDLSEEFKYTIIDFCENSVKLGHNQLGTIFSLEEDLWVKWRLNLNKDYVSDLSWLDTAEFVRQSIKLQPVLIFNVLKHDYKIS